jgi:hypothetical protein
LNEESKAGEKVFSPDPSSIFGSRHLPRSECQTHKKEGWGLGREYFSLPNLTFF